MQKSLSRFLLLFLFSFAISLFSVAAYGSVWYVRSDAPFGGDGTSWATAFRSVQQAINAASSIYIICMSPEDAIWVKRGTYYLSSQIDVNKVVLIYGGFNGTETSLNQRDWKNNETIIDGQSNCRCFNIMSFCQIDGFTIRNGMASSAHGGGIYIDSDPIWCYLGYYLTPKIRNCTITHNTSDYNGGGIYDNESDPDIFNCTFSHNTADIHGGGLYILRSDPTIENCTFSDNSADSGGGLKNWESSPTIEKCLFSGNHSTGAGSWGGGAICTDYLSYGSITNCVFYNNDSVSRGGALASQIGRAHV